MIFLFWFSIIVVIYVYVGYPVLIGLIGLIRNKKVKKNDWEPNVSIVIAAYNEAEHIATTLKNKLRLDYPKDKLEIIVISDASTDGTDEIVKGFDSQGVSFIRKDMREGKTSALNKAVSIAKGEIIVFSDANSMYKKCAIRKLAKNFEDPEVGYVTGKMIYVNHDGSSIGDGCSHYMKYENLLRKFETKAGSIVGVDGGIDAVRKELYKAMRYEQLPDFVLPLKVIEQGYRVVYEPKAILKERPLTDSADEYRMRVRVSLRAFWAMFDMRQLLMFKGSKLFGWQLWSHKVLRYLCFIFLGVAYFTNLSLWSHSSFYKIIFILQNVMYVIGFATPFIERTKYRNKICYLFWFFILVNLASAHAFIKFILGKKQMIWTPRKG